MKLYWTLEENDVIQEGDEMKSVSSQGYVTKGWEKCHIVPGEDVIWHTITSAALSYFQYRRPYTGPLPSQIVEETEVMMRRKITVI